MIRRLERLVSRRARSASAAPVSGGMPSARARSSWWLRTRADRRATTPARGAIRGSPAATDPDGLLWSVRFMAFSMSCDISPHIGKTVLI
jgi:hypothetical protein